MDFDTIRKNLSPKGTKPVVRLSANGFWNHDFIENCINEMERNVMMQQAMGTAPTALEQLAMMILIESSGTNAETDDAV